MLHYFSKFWSLVLKLNSNNWIWKLKEVYRYNTIKFYKLFNTLHVMYVLPWWFINKTTELFNRKKNYWQKHRTNHLNTILYHTPTIYIIRTITPENWVIGCSECIQIIRRTREDHASANLARTRWRFATEKNSILSDSLIVFQY